MQKADATSVCGLPVNPRVLHECLDHGSNLNLMVSVMIVCKRSCEYIVGVSQGSQATVFRSSKGRWQRLSAASDQETGVESLRSHIAAAKVREAPHPGALFPIGASAPRVAT